VPDCRKLLAQMSDYIDGELPPEICSTLEKHLSGCPNCKIMFDSLTKTIRVFKEGAEEPLPESLKASLRSALSRRWERKH